MKSTNERKKLENLTAEFKDSLEKANPTIAFQCVGETLYQENLVKFRTTLFSKDVNSIQPPKGAEVLQRVRPSSITCGYVSFLYKSHVFVMCDMYSLFNNEEKYVS